MFNDVTSVMRRRSATSNSCRTDGRPDGRASGRPGPRDVARPPGLAEHVGEKLIANLATLTIHSGFGSIGNAPAGARAGRAGRLIDGGVAEASGVHLSAPPVRHRVPRESSSAPRRRRRRRRAARRILSVDSAIVDYGPKLNFVASVNELTRRRRRATTPVRRRRRRPRRRGCLE